MRTGYQSLEIRWCIHWKTTLTGSTKMAGEVESFDTQREATEQFEANPCEWERIDAEQFVAVYGRKPDGQIPPGLLFHIADRETYEAATELLDLLSGTTRDERAAAGDPDRYFPPVPAQEAPPPSAATRKQLADDLEAGARADIWYDADHFAFMDRDDDEGDDDDEKETGPQRTIRVTKEAMSEAAAILRGTLPPVTAYDEEHALAAMCIWEAMLEGVRWTVGAPNSAKLSHLEKQFDDEGASAMRSYALSLAAPCEASYNTLTSDQFDDPYDWEYVPAFVALEFSEPGGGGLTGKGLTPAQMGLAVLAEIRREG